MNKLRSLFPNANTNLSLNRNSANLEPELGFQLIFEFPSSTSSTSSSTNNQINEHQKSSPQLNVNLIAARHLPTLFGFKTAQGYVVKVKLFPGSTKYDSCIQTNTWPKFNENFKFSLEPDRKSSIKMSPSKINYNKSDGEIDKFFSGQFVVLTVYALLELPPGNFNRLNKTYRSLKDRSASIVQRIAEQSQNSISSGKNTKSKESTTTKENVAQANNKDKDKDKDKDKNKDKEPVEMTKTESRRNIGSVTCYLEPKIFRKSSKNNYQYLTEELWYPIKDLTISPIKSGNSTSTISSITTSKKGQLELILEICNMEKDDTPTTTDSKSKVKRSSSSVECSSSSEISPKTTSTSTLNSTSYSLTKRITDVTRKLSVRRSKLTSKDVIFKVTTTKFRCSIKEKDELESVGNQIYIKTAIYDDDIPINSWKSNHFIPSLSLRWDPKHTKIEVPLPNLDCLKRMRVKSTIATKNKMGKKIILGTIIINSNAVQQSCADHWKNMIGSRNEQIVMWHNFQ